MRYEDASQAGSMTSDVTARDDTDHLAGNDFGPATGNLITGSGTISGATGTDIAGAGAAITAIAGAGGSDNAFDANGKLEVAGQYGTLTIDAAGNYTYVRNPGSPEGVSDTFTYTLASPAGAADSAKLVIAIGNPPILQAQGTQTIQTADGVVVLPAGVELSDVRVVGRDLVITLPDGSTMVIPDGAVFVPQLVVNGVEVPASNLAALLIDSEPKPAAGDLSPSQQSGGGNFALPPGPLDPGVPLGDLLPPTQLNYTPPEFKDPGIEPEDDPPVAGITGGQLDDDVIPGKGGNPGGIGDEAPDTVGANEFSGFLPGSGGGGGLTWALLESGAPAGFTYDLQPDGSIQVIQTQDGNPVVVLTITVNAATGAYTVTQDNPIRHATGDNENNVSFAIGYTVSNDGGVATGTLNISVDDDTPTASVTAGSDAAVTLTTDDAQTEGDASDTAVTLADFSGVFTGTSTSAGADGAGAGTTGGYTLGVTSVTSGLSSHGSAINLYMVGTTVVGATGTQPADLNDPDIVFTVAVNGSGIVTLTQKQQIDHADEAPSATDAPFADQLATLADGLVTLTRSVTVVDKDGDSVSASASVNIGANLKFTDDGPVITDIGTGGSVILDETDGGEPVSAGAPIVVTSEDPMIAVTGVDYGADGKGPDPVYGLSLLGGGPVGSSIASGLQTAAGDFPITLTLTSSTLITATYQNGGTQTAFTIQMNTDGTVTVTQNTALEHLDDGSTPAKHDDSLNLTTVVNEQTVSLVNATVTVEDFDGDTDTESAGIGDAITFKDDGPSITITATNEAGVLLTTGDDGTEGDGETSAFTSADFGAAFSIGSSSGGGDGTASASLLEYSLATAGGDSGLESNGDPINLYMVGTTVVGATGSQPANLDDADIIFTVEVSATGVVTLTQLQQIDHPVEASPVPGTDAPFTDQTISILNDSLITLTASATITDNDGDTASDSETINIASNLVFQDDGPTINATLDANASVHVDESDPGVDGAGETDNPGLGQVTVALSAIVDVTENPESADQPTTLTYDLVLGEGAEGTGLVDSGMITSDGDDPIYLFDVGGVVYGTTSTTAPVGIDANTVFTVTISGGNVVLTQYQAIEHPTAGAEGPAHDENTTGLAEGALLIEVTGTDYDGDTDTAMVDLGSVITFGDDGPSVDVVEGTLPTDPQALEAFQLTTQDHGTEDAGSTTDSTTINFSGLFSMNKDGGSDGEASSSLAYDLDLVGTGNGPVDSGLTSHGQTIWLYQVDSNTVIGSTSGSAVSLGDPSIVFQLVTTNAGAVTQTQFQQIDHVTVDPSATGTPFDDHIVALGSGLINVVATGTITDNDGDTDKDEETIDLGGLVRFQDDGPTADNEGNIATVDDGVENFNIGNVSTLLDGDNYHADGPAAVGAITIATGNQGGSITIDGSGNLLYTPAADASGGDVVETFTYTIKDFDGDTATGTFTVTLTDSGAVVGTTENAVDEEGLNGGIPGTVYGDGSSDLAGENASVSGTLTGLDFGDDGAGTIVLTESNDTGLRTLANQVVKSSWNGSTLTGYVDGNGNNDFDVGETQVFTLQITDVATGAYTFTLLQPVKHATANTEDDVILSVEVTVADSENDGSTGTINITIDDDSPRVSDVAGGGSVTLDETNAAAGNVPGSFPISASSLTAVITATKAFGADGAAAVGDTVYGLSLAGNVNSIASGLQTAVGDLPITLNLVNSTTITGTYNGGANTAFTITMNSDGTITVQQNVPLEHLVDGPPGPDHDDSLDLVIDGTGGTNLINATITIKDADGDTHSGSTPIGDQITFKDDGPTINVTKGADAGVTVTTDDADTIDTATDMSTPTSINFGGVFGLSSTPGADGAATPSLSFQLDVTGYVDGVNAAGVDSGLDQGNNTIYLYEIGGKVVGSTAATKNAVVAGNTVFEVAVSGTGVVTLTQFSQVNHPIADDPSATGSPFADDDISILDSLVTLTASSTITDNDGDTASDSETVDIGANLIFTDHGPTAAINETGAGVSSDESAGNQSDSNDVDGPLTVFDSVTVKGVDPHMPNPQFSTNVNAVVNSTGTNLGADGLGSIAFSLTTSDPNNLGVDSGLDVTSGESIILFKEGNLVVGRVSGGAHDGQAAFALSIDSSGKISMVQYLSIKHGDSASKDESLTIADGALLAVVTATDFDGDTSTASTPIGNRISFQDDAPVLTAAQNLNIQNGSADMAHSGLFTFNVGADGPKPTDDAVKSVTFSAVVNNVTVQTTVPLTQVSEDAHTAVFEFSFSYSTGSGTAQNTGTITFYKDDFGGATPGTYKVDLADPIAGISTPSVQGGEDPVFYDIALPPAGPSGDVDNGVAVVQIATDFWIQFTGRQNVSTLNDFGHDDTWTGGSQAEVKISSTAIGVFGNSVQSPDVLDFNFYAGDPGAALGPPTKSAGTAFIKVAQFNVSEDFVVTLKLADPTNPGTFITRTVIIDGTDVLTTAPAGYPALGTNEGYIIFQPNDYLNLPGVPAGYQIVGMQLRSSSEGSQSTNDDPATIGINEGEVYNFNGALGAFDNSTRVFTAAGGGDTGTNDNDVFKIIDIGVQTITTVNQTASLTFTVTIQDGDGDELSQVLTTTITQDIDSTSNITIDSAKSTVVPVALDTSGDGAVAFLAADAGVVYDYNGDGIAEATPWVAPGDSILVRDANGDGEVSTSEFIFGGNGMTDLEALHAQYGAQLDASDADFTMFAVWNDANSNGVVDGNELQSLAEAGITSIDLVSDGIAYTAADGDVSVAGTASFTRADGSTGDVADAAFAIGGAKSTQEVERVAANSNSVTLAAAVAAAGLAASSAAAAEAPSFGNAEAVVTNALVARETLSAFDTSDASSSFSALDAIQDSGFDFGPLSLASTSYQAIAASHIGELTANWSVGDTPTALLDATDFSVMLQMPAVSNGMAVTPSLESLLPQVSGLDALANGGLGQILADALQGGSQMQSIDALLNSLPSAGIGENGGLGSLASPGGPGVSTWDMGQTGVFTFDLASFITSEAMLLHHDAVQPVANG